MLTFFCFLKIYKWNFFFAKLLKYFHFLGISFFFKLEKISNIFYDLRYLQLILKINYNIKININRLENLLWRNIMYLRSQYDRNQNNNGNKNNNNVCKKAKKVKSVESIHYNHKRARCTFDEKAKRPDHILPTWDHQCFCVHCFYLTSEKLSQPFNLLIISSWCTASC